MTAQSYQLAEDLGKAFSERLVLESTLAAEQQAEAGSMKQVLGLLRTLFVLSVADEGAVFLRYVRFLIRNSLPTKNSIEFCRYGDCHCVPHCKICNKQMNPFYKEYVCSVSSDYSHCE